MGLFSVMFGIPIEEIGAVCLIEVAEEKERLLNKMLLKRFPLLERSVCRCGNCVLWKKCCVGEDVAQAEELTGCADVFDEDGDFADCLVGARNE